MSKSQADPFLPNILNGNRDNLNEAMYITINSERADE